MTAHAIKPGSLMHVALRHVDGATLPRVAGGRFRRGGRSVSADRATALVGAGLAAFNVNGGGRTTGLTITAYGRAALADIAERIKP